VLGLVGMSFENCIRLEIKGLIEVVSGWFECKVYK
jgi:hypothetical protein